MMINIPKIEKITIGRTSNHLINFPDDVNLSNFHSIISFIDGSYFIEDGGSTNGTWERLSL